MKTNLTEIFGTDQDLETNGKWFDISSDVKFKLKRMGGKNATEFKKLNAKFIKPYHHQMQKGTIDPEIELDIFINVFVRLCLVDWKGLKDHDGNIIEFNLENAIALFKETPDLFGYVVDLAKEEDNYREELGNS